VTARFAKAYPRKQFFLEMFTRDISLEDCILDLIDNSIDGLIRSKSIDLLESLFTIEQPVFGQPVPHSPQHPLPQINVNYSNTKVEIDDTCGGIPLDHAENDVFCFGHTPGDLGGQLGVYGIGLKRAIFKIGDQFKLRSRTMYDGFDVQLDVRAWAKKDETLDDWRIPLSRSSAAGSSSRAGTRITITRLHEEVVMRLEDGQLERSLRQKVAQAYALFVNRYVRIALNGKAVEPAWIPVGASTEVTPGHQDVMIDGVSVRIIAGLAERDSSQEWSAERAGWYVFCNGRAILSADKSDVSGWGGGAPHFHSKYRGFVGLAIFLSKDPLSLPWTTTKRGINRESGVYQQARQRMVALMHPVLRFLDRMYPSDSAEQAEQRRIANQVHSTDIRSIVAGPNTPFTVSTKSKAKKKTTVRVSIEVERHDVRRIASWARKPDLSATKAVQIALDHFLRTECPE
jgi:Histidine kinase-, DNA gyrase B-, and HSP90-like ATPase